MPRGLNLYDTARLADALANKNQLAPLASWHSKDAYRTSSNIFAWPEEKGQYSFVAADAGSSANIAAQPYGRRGVTFDGGDGADNNFGGHNFPLGFSPSTFFAVWDQPNSTTHKLFEYGFGGGNGPARTIGVRNGFVDCGCSGSGYDHTTNLSGVGPTIIAWQLLSDRSSTIWVNGGVTPHTFTMPVGWGGTTGNRFILGQHTNAGEKWPGSAYYIGAHDRALAQFERHFMEGFLAWEFNMPHKLAASHPFKNRPPLIGD